MMTRYEREIIAKYDRYKAQWWLLSPKELKDLERLKDIDSDIRWKMLNGGK